MYYKDLPLYVCLKIIVMVSSVANTIFINYCYMNVPK